MVNYIPIGPHWLFFKNNGFITESLLEKFGYLYYSFNGHLPKKLQAIDYQRKAKEREPLLKCTKTCDSKKASFAY